MKELIIKIVSLFTGGGASQAKSAMEDVGKGAQRARSRVEEFRTKLYDCWKSAGLFAGGIAGLASALVGMATNAAASAFGSIVGMGKAFVEGVKAVADYAGKMSDLSAQTGQSVEETMLLVQAFRNAGLGGESAGQAINLLQRALAGVNEEGRPTKEVFDKLGLSQAKLRNMSATDALQQIAAAIAGLGTDAERTQAAMDLFGRSGGRMLALLKDTEAFDTARTQLGGLATAIGASAGDLDKFSDAIGSMDLKGLQFYAGFARGLSGDLSSAADALNRLDFSGPGTQLGLMARGAADLAKELKAAAEASVALLPGDDKANAAGARQGLAMGADALITAGPGGAVYGLAKWLIGRGKDSATQDRLDKFDAEQMVKPQPMDTAWDQTELDAFEPQASRQDELDAFEPVTAPDDDPTGLKAAEAARVAAAKKAEAEAAKAAKREELALELQLAEAKASGNTAEQKRLEWMREYNRLLEEGKAAGMGDDAYNYAIRGANAGATEEAGKDGQTRYSLSQSDMQRVGGAAGERATLTASLVQESRKTNELLRQIRDKKMVVSGSVVPRWGR